MNYRHNNVDKFQSFMLSRRSQIQTCKMHNTLPINFWEKAKIYQQKAD